MVRIEEFIKEKYSAKNTWPMKPLGTIKKSSRDSKNSSQYIKQMREEQEYLTTFLNTFLQSRLMYVTWILSASIGILGNIIVSYRFSSPVNNVTNNLAVIFGLFFLLVLVLSGMMYIESPKFMFGFIPDYYSFPHGYNKFVNPESLKKVESKILVQYDIIETVSEFSNLVLMMILRDHMVEAMKKVKHLHIAEVNVDTSGSILAYITIKSNNRAFIFPVQREVFVREFLIVIGGFLRCRTLCNVLGFETNEEEWKKHGATFIDKIVEWDIEDGIIQLKDEIEAL